MKDGAQNKSSIMMSIGVDPEYQRYRRAHPKFPGIDKCVELLCRPNVQGAYFDGVMGDLEEHAAAEELVAALSTETDQGVRALLLSVIAESPLEVALPILVEALLDLDESARFWAARALHALGTPVARRVLWEARSKKLATPAETQQFQQMLADVGPRMTGTGDVANRYVDSGTRKLSMKGTVSATGSANLAD